VKISSLSDLPSSLSDLRIDPVALPG
jgi:hypothetical protein